MQIYIHGKIGINRKNNTQGQLMIANNITITNNMHPQNAIPPRNNIKNASGKLSFFILSLTKLKNPTINSLQISNISFMFFNILVLTFHNEHANQQNALQIN